MSGGDSTKPGDDDGLPGSKLFFGTVVGWLTCWVRSYGSCDMEHAAPGSVLRASISSNASSGLAGPPTGG